MAVISDDFVEPKNAVPPVPLSSVVWAEPGFAGDDAQLLLCDAMGVIRSARSCDQGIYAGYAAWRRPGSEVARCVEVGRLIVGGDRERLGDVTDARILVVADDIKLQTVTADMVSRLGFEVAAVGTGEEVLALLWREAFDLVLLDIDMPGLDGFKVLSRIREREDTGSHLPVVAVTGQVGGRQAEYAEAGFDGYLAKPFRLLQLSEAIHGHLSTRTQRP